MIAAMLELETRLLETRVPMLMVPLLASVPVTLDADADTVLPLSRRVTVKFATPLAVS
jgi:hypothetical protein